MASPSQAATRTVGVLGAGIQGACTALALADKGARVLLIEREPEAITKASLWNEGKIHLGYLFANDRVAHTARRMIDGAGRFWPFLSRYIPEKARPDLISSPFTYAVHRDSLIDAEAIAIHFARVSSEIKDRHFAGAYFGVEDAHAWRRLSDAAVEETYSSEKVVAAFETQEVSIDTLQIADALRAAVNDHPLIAFLPDRHVDRVEDGARGKLRIVLRDSLGGEDALSCDSVVNALWSDRLRIDAQRGLAPRAPYRFRHKLAIHTKGAGFPHNLRSTTLMLGQFGDIVRFPKGRSYLSWYPHCLLASSGALQPPRWDALADAARKETIRQQVLAELEAVAPAVGDIDFSGADVHLEGGTIFSWGDGNIDDLKDDVHKRFEIGLVSAGAYHTIDTGKYGMGPLFAEDAAAVIAGDAAQPLRNVSAG